MQVGHILEVSDFSNYRWLILLFSTNLGQPVMPYSDRIIQGFCSIGCPTHRKDDILNWLLAAAWYREVYCNELLQLNTLIYLTDLSSNVLPWCCFLCFPFAYMSSFLISGLPILQIPWSWVSIICQLKNTTFEILRCNDNIYQ